MTDKPRRRRGTAASPPRKPVNLAFFVAEQRRLLGEFFAAAGVPLSPRAVFLVTADTAVSTRVRATLRRSSGSVLLKVAPFSDLGFLQVPISFRDIEHRIQRWIGAAAGGGARPLLAVDMSWGLLTNSAAANFENWMVAAESLAANSGVSVVSLYNRRLLIDEQLLAALRGHPGILSRRGIVDNPHWLPAQLLTHGTLRQQIDHLLAATVPDIVAAPASAVHAAEGANPMWLLRQSTDDPPAPSPDSRERWKIRCFGRLHVYRADGSQIDWEVPGGATRKTKTLFAYLLQQGGQGATSDELADLLWPDASSAEVAKNRLYHTVKCLREALAPPSASSDAGRRFLLRDGARYVLIPPEKSWLDISTFEQLCRQSRSHTNSGASEEALMCLRAADRLYTGDLFGDIPAEYTDNNERDWCWSRRYWLRDMFFKVQRDAARIYRERHDYSTALIHCQKALAIDPLCEIAHEEAMHVFDAQGRRDAIDRQYKLYLTSLGHFDDRPQSAALRRTYAQLSGTAMRA
jgi:two-component SAPR family response regulator